MTLIQKDPGHISPKHRRKYQKYKQEKGNLYNIGDIH
jgi:hypothetical protein